MPAKVWISRDFHSTVTISNYIHCFASAPSCAAEVLSFIALDATKPFFVTWAHANKAARECYDPILVGLDSNILKSYCDACKSIPLYSTHTCFVQLWSNSSCHIYHFSHLWRASTGQLCPHVKTRLSWADQLCPSKLEWLS